ncbi:MAG TPA: DUF5682 family protein [Pilimelia sp.]|nr:DUF5682 family protein [Pilimelia sp.]
MTSPVLLGVRHHGPGSARAVRRALAAYRPDVVLIEGPPEADALIRYAADAAMRPPVALLAYPADLPAGRPRADATEAGTGQEQGGGAARAAFWPFADFSPEWQAIRWATRHAVPVRFCDQPAAQQFARSAPVGAATGEPVDPLGALATAAGYDSAETWWEDVVEHRVDAAVAGAAEELARALAPFEAIAEAMSAVRAAAPPRADADRAVEDQREAHMRTVLRAALREHARVAVVCGAWHVPALAGPLPPAAHDARVLRRLPKAKIAITWVPWTHGRLASWSGYGAGVTAPGWYHHLFTTADHAVPRWLVQVAGVLRAEGHPVSSAHVIEGVRLAEALAALRGRPAPGLPELTEAVRAVLCEGDDLRVALVDRQLVVGDVLGEVPADLPAVPLIRDVAAAQRRLRLPPEAAARDVDLDLRRDSDRGRSHLLRRLGLLGVPWGATLPARRGKGTFWESWRLAWQPEFAVDLIAASGYGSTLPAAAAARVRERAASADTLAGLTELVEACLLADLSDALPDVLRALDARVAADTDVGHLLTALPPLARTLRYGDVRATDAGGLGSVAAGLVVRACVHQPGAPTALDEAAARGLRAAVDGAHGAVALLAEAGADRGGPDLRERWFAALDRAAGRPGAPALLAGRLVRLLADSRRLDQAEVGRRMAVALSAGTPPADGAAWIEGFLGGGGLLLVHDRQLLGLVDAWLSAVPPAAFVDVLPLLRRTFGEFAAPERRAIGDRVRPLRPGDTGAGPVDDLDQERADIVLPTLAALLGWEVAA